MHKYLWLRITERVELFSAYGAPNQNQPPIEIQFDIPLFYQLGAQQATLVPKGPGKIMLILFLRKISSWKH